MLLGGVAVAGDGAFDEGGLVFGVGHVVVEGSGDGDALGAPELEHGLGILAEEGGLDGEVVGVVSLDDVVDGVEDL